MTLLHSTNLRKNLGVTQIPHRLQPSSVCLNLRRECVELGYNVSLWSDDEIMALIDVEPLDEFLKEL